MREKGWGRGVIVRERWKIGGEEEVINRRVCKTRMRVHTKEIHVFEQVIKNGRECASQQTWQKDTPDSTYCRIHKSWLLISTRNACLGTFNTLLLLASIRYTECYTTSAQKITSFYSTPINLWQQKSTYHEYVSNNAPHIQVMGTDLND